MHTRSTEDRHTQLMASSEATATTGGGETKDHNPPDVYPLCRTEASKVTRSSISMASSRSSQSDHSDSSGHS